MRIIATDEVPPVAHRAFAPLGRILVRSDDPAAELLIVRGRRLAAADLERLPALRAIARTGAGYDNVDVEAATRRGVPIVYAPAVGSRPVAEGAVALMLAAAKQLRELGSVVESSQWARRYDTPVLDIDAACLGVVGFGSIGREVARLGRGLGMDVVAYDPAVDGLAEAGTELVALEELLERADVITLHCELTADTIGLVDRQLHRAGQARGDPRQRRSRSDRRERGRARRRARDRDGCRRSLSTSFPQSLPTRVTACTRTHARSARLTASG